VALLVDEVFQSIGIERAKIYTKMLLNLIEHPPGDYEKIVAVVTTSEGVSIMGACRAQRHKASI